MSHGKLYGWAISHWNELLKANPAKSEENYGYVALVFDDDGDPNDNAVDFVYDEDYITYRVYCDEDEDSYDLQYILDSDIPNMNIKLTIAENRTFEQITTIIKNLMNKNKI